jgi:hypothetical protein
MGQGYTVHLLNILNKFHSGFAVISLYCTRSIPYTVSDYMENEIQKTYTVKVTIK